MTDTKRRGYLCFMWACDWHGRPVARNSGTSSFTVGANASTVPFDLFLLLAADLLLLSLLCFRSIVFIFGWTVLCAEVCFARGCIICRVVEVHRSGGQ